MKNSFGGSRNYRIVTAVFGLFFVVLAVAIVVVSDRTVGPLLAAVVISVWALMPLPAHSAPSIRCFPVSDHYRDDQGHKAQETRG